MKKNILLVVIILIIATAFSFAQQKIPPSYIQTSGKISLSSSMPITQAIQALSEISARLEQKAIILEKIRTDPINVEIVDMHWKEALDIITKVNNLKYEEFPTYIKITDKEEEPETEAEKKYDSTIREVNISAIFFEGDRHLLKEKGINWSVLVNQGSAVFEAGLNLIEPGPIYATAAEVTDDYTLDLLLTALESQSIGEVLASPNIQVLEGEEGQVQVGQDFSIKTLDFAGNTTTIFISTGIILTVTPTVIQEDSLNFIHLDITTEKSSVTPGEVTTIISKITTSTQLFLLDGERAAIAGLYSTTETKERSGIPILKDLPWWFLGIRYLAGFDRKEITERELVIIIKAELLPALQKREISKIENMEYIRQKVEELKKKFQKK